MHLAQSPAVRHQRIGCLGVVLIPILGFPLLILAGTDKPILATARIIWPLLLGPPLFIAVALAHIKWRTGRLSKRMLAEGRNSGFYGQCALSLDEHGIRESKENGESMRKWSAVEKVITTKAHLFVYTSGVEGFVIPRRAFGSESDFEQFVRFVAKQSNVAPQHA
jgi:hypothetical protein